MKFWGEAITDNDITGKKFGNVLVFNFSKRHKKWYVLVADGDSVKLRRANREQILSGTIPDEVIKRLVGNPYIHFNNGITVMVDLNGILIYIDTVDYATVRDITWRGHKDSRRDDGIHYVYGGTWDKENKRWKNESLHGYLFKRLGIEFEQIDHIDRDPLNNTRGNLRVATHTENVANRGLFKNNKVGFTGVRRIGDRYAARITVDGVETHLGCYGTAEEAYKVRLEAEKKYFNR